MFFINFTSENGYGFKSQVGLKIAKKKSKNRCFGAKKKKKHTMSFQELEATNKTSGTFELNEKSTQNST